MPQPREIRKPRLYDASVRPLSRNGEPVRALVGGGQAYPSAANIQSPSDAELLDIISRALRGDLHPASGRNGARAALDEPAPISSVIRGILQREPTAEIHRPIAPELDVSDVELEWEPVEAAQHEPKRSDSPPELQSQIVIPDNSNPVRLPRRRWAFGLSSIAFVVAMSIVGASIPAWLAGPPRYVAQARLQLQGEPVSQQGLLGAIAARLSSPHLLSQVVAKLKLDRDAEFTGGKTTAMGVVFDLFAGSGGASDAPSRAQAKLRDSLLVASDQRTGALQLSIVSGNAAKSARIANLLADVAVYDAAMTQNTTASGKGAAAADASSKAYDQAVAALAAFRAEVGDDKIKAAVELQQQRKDMDAEVAAAANAVQTAQIRITAAKTTKLADILDGSLSPDLGSPAGLEELRNRYAAEKSTLSQLSAQLGPRHPRLLAQQSTVDGLRAQIQAELQRLVASCDAELKLALSDQKSLADKVVALGQKTVGIDMVRFGQLQDGAETARARYEAALQTVGIDKPSATPVPLSVAVPAVAPAWPLDDNLAAAEMTGFLMALGIAICLVFLRTWVADALLSDEDAAVDINTPEPNRNKAVEEKRPAIEPPPLRFDITTSVANDRPFRETERAPAAPVVDENLAVLQDGMASLRAKVETYALQRRAAPR
ncbi:succinoglycan biosynthesis protein exop [Rhizobium tubonense]|uniref:succinoglycan biosynthesis protein exop n=1 Tax=Rhizobium tubonense TaxID=484088 RepID=UPI000DAA3C22|nr:succinoglycan biosynthesis protein exop [Rhizobium tubonense]